MADIKIGANTYNGVEVLKIPLANGEGHETFSLGSSGGTLDDFIPEEAFHITGSCSYRFANSAWDWFINMYGDKIATSDIVSTDKMFISSNVENIPFDINIIDGGGNANYMFADCKNLKSVRPIDFKQTSAQPCYSMFNQNHKNIEIGKLSNLYPSDMNRMFFGCSRLRQLPEFDNLNLTAMQISTSAAYNYLFANCYSLRSIPENLLGQFYGLQTSAIVPIFNNGFNCCYTLDEIVGLNPKTGTIIDNAFVNAFSFVSRVKDIVFKIQQNGEPYSANWKNQTIDLSNHVGYGSDLSNITTGYNSGITIDKRVTDDATYQALKNDPDWFTLDVNYSRYNHNSAVNTINSLPDTSAYLASAGGSNTIKFTGQSGALTDGGAINTLTEEEIAVATAKGWTVSFV